MKRIQYSLLLCIIVSAICISCQNYKYRDMEVYPIMEKGLYGFIDTLGNKVVIPQYICVSNFNNHLAAAVVDTFYEYRRDSTLHKLGLGYANNVSIERYLYLRYGYINIENDFVIAPTLLRRFQVEENIDINAFYLEDLTSLLSFHNGLAAYQDSITNLYGFVDTLGQVKVPARYYGYQNFSTDKAAVQIFKCNDDEPITDACFKWGYIDTQGNKVSEFIYKDLTPCLNGRSFGTMWSKATDQEKHPIITQNDNGELEIEDPDFDDNMPMQALVTVLLDENGKVINNSLPSIYTYYSYTEDGVAVAVRQGTELFGPDFKFVDKKGNFLKPRNVNNTNPFFVGVLPDDYYFANITAMYGGYAGVMGNDGKWLFVDKNLNLYAPINDIPYDNVKRFINGLAGVCQNGKWGYIDKNFNVIIPFKYDWVSDAGKHLMRVFQKDDNSHVVIESYINKKDSIVWQRVDNKNK